jgi:hypothetical protein
LSTLSSAAIAGLLVLDEGAILAANVAR